MSWAEAMRRFGSDRPDLRVALELTDVDDLMRDVQFKVFSGPANDAGSRVVATRVPNGCALSRGEIDAYTKFVGVYGPRVWPISASIRRMIFLAAYSPPS